MFYFFSSSINLSAYSTAISATCLLNTNWNMNNSMELESMEFITLMAAFILTCCQSMLSIDFSFINVSIYTR